MRYIIPGDCRGRNLEEGCARHKIDKLGELLDLPDRRVPQIQSVISWSQWRNRIITGSITSPPCRQCSQRDLVQAVCPNNGAFRLILIVDFIRRSKHDPSKSMSKSLPRFWII
jgi:hypothetical protein